MLIYIYVQNQHVISTLKAFLDIRSECDTIRYMKRKKRGLNLNRVFHFRTSEEEWEWLKKLSSDLGLSPGAYLRMEIHKRAKELM